MQLVDAILDSWDLQCQIVRSVAERIDASNRTQKPTDDGWPLDHQLAHIHAVRRYWLKQVSPERGGGLESSFIDGWMTPITDLDAIRRMLDESAVAVREGAREVLQSGAPVGGYDHPVLFLQHMVWHEGWHVGLILTGLRLAGQEAPEEWEEEHVWGQWRTETY